MGLGVLLIVRTVVE